MVPETIALSPELQMRIRETFTLLTSIDNTTSVLICKESCSLKLVTDEPFRPPHGNNTPDRKAPLSDPPGSH